MLLIKFGQFWAVSISNMIFCSFLFFWLSHYAYVCKLNDAPHFFNLQFPVLDLCTLNKVAQGQSGSPCSECSAPHIETLQYDWAVQTRVPDLATLTRNLVSATEIIVMKTAGDISLTWRKPCTLTGSMRKTLYSWCTCLELVSCWAMRGRETVDLTSNITDSP